MLNHVFALGIVGTVLLHSAAQAPRSDTQPPVRFRVDVDFVEIDAIVTDAGGRVVRDLTKEEFQILEDGRPQAIGAFMRVDIPIVRAESTTLPAAAEPDVFSNTPAFDGRLFVLVLDDLQTAHANTPLVRSTARRFVEEYTGANDLIAVVQTSGFVPRQDFTASRPRVIAAIDRFIGSKLLSATRLKMEDAQLQQNVPPEFRNTPQDTAEAARGHRARTSLEVLLGLSDYLGGIRGRRKSIVYIGEGIDYDVRERVAVDEPGITRDIRTIQAAMTDLIAAATRANVAVYTLDPRGLVTGMEDAIATGTPSISGSKVADPAYGFAMTSMMDEMSRSHASLRTIAEETGGLAFLNDNDDRIALSRILEDSSSYYILGYHPGEARRDGRYRRIDVRVTRPGLHVRSRRGFVALDAKKTKPPPVAALVSAPLRAALDSPIPVSGLGLSVFAAPFQGQAPNASVAIVIEVDPSRLTFVQRGGLFLSDVEILIAAFDPRTGKPIGVTVETAHLRLRPETHALVAKEGVRITRRIAVPPGRYRLQVGAREVNGGGVGTIVADLDVPELFSPEMQMSAVVLASQAAAARVPTANQDPLLKDALPAAPTTTRVFEAGDTLASYAEVYPGNPKSVHRVAIRTRVLADGRRSVFDAEDERQTADLGGAPAWRHSATIPLTGFGPGRYVLRMEARRLLSDPQMIARELEFRVR